MLDRSELDVPLWRVEGVQGVRRLLSCEGAAMLAVTDKGDAYAWGSTQDWNLGASSVSQRAGLIRIPP